VAPLLWMAHAAPGWMHELSANLAAVSAHGQNADPGPASSGAHGLAMITDLQTVLSLVRDDPRFYNPIAYLICGALLLVWGFKTLRAQASPRAAFFALASVSALTLLPVYHRQYDAKLLLLAIPACCLLWMENGALKWPALAVTAAGVVVSADLPWAIFMSAVNNIPILTRGGLGQFQIVFQVCAVPLALLIVAVFYLSIDWNRPENQPLNRQT
jgi:hypothetical protein